MNTTDSATWKQWVDEDLEGELAPPEKARLAEVLESEPEARAERRALASLHEAIAEDRIAVRPGFRARVMAALRPAWWEERRPEGLPSWSLPLAAMLFLALGAALILVKVDAAGNVGQAMGLGVAVLDFMQTTFLAGAGMLFATWRGVGLGVEKLIGDSTANLFAFAIGILFLDLLFFALLRRRARAAAKADSDI